VDGQLRRRASGARAAIHRGSIHRASMYYPNSDFAGATRWLRLTQADRLRQGYGESAEAFREGGSPWAPSRRTTYPSAGSGQTRLAGCPGRLARLGDGGRRRRGKGASARADVEEGVAVPYGGRADEQRGEAPAPAAHEAFAGPSFRERGFSAPLDGVPSPSNCGPRFDRMRLRRRASAGRASSGSSTRSRTSRDRGSTWDPACLRPAPS